MNSLPYAAVNRAAISSVRRIESRITLASASNSSALAAHDSAILGPAADDRLRLQFSGQGYVFVERPQRGAEGPV
jgi:hypothetical protein